MLFNRRKFLKTTTLSGLAAAVPLSMASTSCTTSDKDINAIYKKLDKASARPVLKKELFPSEIIIETLELLRYKDVFICKVRSKDGAEGISVSNNMQMVALYPIFKIRLQHHFIGQDARDLEQLLEDAYMKQSNYKLQGLAFWVPLATIEFAILDLLGRIAEKPIGQLIGDIHNPKISVYQANNFRGRSADESLDRIKQQVEESSAKAVKFKIGGRMNNEEEPKGRTEKLIPLVRKTFGDDMTIYADSNGSYDAKEAIRIGKVLEEYNIDFYEEPVAFDWYEDTKTVADALSIPIAGGEQEPSLRNFRWLIAHNALDVVQPDIFYFGGMIRSMRVARMADAVGKTCVPHISKSGLGYLYMMHFVSALKNSGPYHEFKGFNNAIPISCESCNLKTTNGQITVPKDPGLGVDIDPDYLKKFTEVKV